MAKWRKKPVVVEAEVYQPGMEDGFEYYDVGGKFLGCFDNGTPCPRARKGRPHINTLEGWHIISPGDYIITGVKGERYPCKPDIFHATHSPATEGIDKASEEIDRLAQFILKNIPGEPSRSESAVDTAIRLLKRLIPEPGVKR